jgi:hypothetical protein
MPVLFYLQLSFMYISVTSNGTVQFLQNYMQLNSSAYATDLREYSLTTYIYAIGVFKNMFFLCLWTLYCLEHQNCDPLF